MAIAEALQALAEAWPQVAARLSAADDFEIRRQLAAAVHGSGWDPSTIFRVALRDEPADHPVWQALAFRAARREAALAVPTLAVAAHLRWVIERTAPTRSEAPDEIEAAAEQRLRLVPMREVPPDAVPEDTLVLEWDGVRFAPGFQFDDSGALLPAAVVVNQLLEVAEDPWGSASWWLSPHASLHAIPADEIRVGSPDLVVAAAAALAEE